MLALPTFALPHKDPNLLTHRDTRTQLQDVNLAEVVTTAQAAAGDGADGLPTTWCGNETGGDNAARRAPPAKAQFKVVYAYAADRPNRFAGWKDALQANVAIVQRFLSAQDGGTKGLRFDMGTALRPAVRRHPDRPAAGRRARPTPTTSPRSPAPSSAPLGAAGGPRNAIVLADGLSGSAQEYGLGETVMGVDRRAPGRGQHPQPRRADLDPLQPRRRRRARRAALGLVAGGLPARDDAQPRRRPVGRAALDAAARRQTHPQYGHCWQGADVMCYVEDAGAAHAMQNDCAGAPGRDPAELRLRPRRLLQPGAAPPAPTWRRTGTRTTRPSWRPAARSRRPAAAARCGCPSRPPPRPPRRSPAPPRRGQTLTASVGAWTNRPTGYAYQWQRLVAAGWEDIDGATGATYVAASEDLGRRLRVAVVATNETAARAPPPPRAPRRRRRPQPRREPDLQEGQEEAAVKAKSSKKKKAVQEEEGREEEEGRARARATRHNAGMAESLRGKLILASPVLKDPNFVRTVVLIAEHTDEGAMGLVLNRPAASTVGEAVPDLSWLAGDEEPVYVGGPVAETAVIVLAEFDKPELAGALVEDDLGFIGADADDPERLAARSAARGCSPDARDPSQGRARMLQMRVSSFWHNSFDDIGGNRSEDLTSLVTSRFPAPRRWRGSSWMPRRRRSRTCSTRAVAQTTRSWSTISLMVLASIANGFRLQKDAEKLGFPKHPEIDADLIMAQSEGVSIGQELTFTVASPMQAELADLRKESTMSGSRS